MEGPLLQCLCSFPWCLAHRSRRRQYIIEPSCPLQSCSILRPELPCFYNSLLPPFPLPDPEEEALGRRTA